MSRGKPVSVNPFVLLFSVEHFFLDEKNLGKLVSWGSDESEVTINFIAGDDDTYELNRGVDREGKSKASLQKVMVMAKTINSKGLK